MALRPPLASFVKTMNDKLLANDYRRGWRGCTNAYLLNMLNERRKGLNDCILNNGTTAEIDSWCADIANFAMMISDIQKQKEQL